MYYIRYNFLILAKSVLNWNKWQVH